MKVHGGSDYYLSVFIYLRGRHHFSDLKVSHSVGRDYRYMQRDYLVPIPKARVVGGAKTIFSKKKKTFSPYILDNLPARFKSVVEGSITNNRASAA